MKLVKAMSVDKQHLRYYLLFAFQLQKTAAEVKQIICLALSEDIVLHSTSKKFQRYKSGNLDFEAKGNSGQLQTVEYKELVEF